jgi:hypothetical protein
VDNDKLGGEIWAAAILLIALPFVIQNVAKNYRAQDLEMPSNWRWGHRLWLAWLRAGPALIALNALGIIPLLVVRAFQHLEGYELETLEMVFSGLTLLGMVLCLATAFLGRPRAMVPPPLRSETETTPSQRDT